MNTVQQKTSAALPAQRKHSVLKRRNFLATVAGASAGILILPRTRLFGAAAPSNKLNIALIGAWGRASQHYKAISTENVVALCDVNENHLALAQKQFPTAKPYIDWRKALEQKDINAVLCCTADHTHAFVGTWAMNRGYHVYLEKPLAISVEEARTVRATYLKNKNKLATQMGTQRHANENFNRVREMVMDGAVGELKEVSAWGNRQIPRPSYPAGEGEPPKHLHWDLWLGPSPYHPYSTSYFATEKPGANCLSWNMYWDFGAGQIGDMGAHTMDLAWCALDATLPTSAFAKGDPINKDVTPVKMQADFQFAANSWRPGIKVSWFQGGAMPDSPLPFIDLNKIGHGAMYEGTKGVIIADFQKHMLYPYEKGGDLTYYKPRTKENLLPPLGDFQGEWINACKGNLKTTCNFEYSGNMIETMLLGLVAYRVGKKIKYDGAAGKVTDCPEADALLRRKYRDGWVLNG